MSTILQHPAQDAATGTSTSNRAVAEQFAEPEPMPFWGQTLLAIAGVFVGWIAATYSSYLKPSWELAFFVFVMVFYLVARVAPEVVLARKKLARLLFGLALPLACALIVGLTYMAGAEMWLAVTLGLVVGGIAHDFGGPWLFPLAYTGDDPERLAEREEWPPRDNLEDVRWI